MFCTYTNTNSPSHSLILYYRSIAEEEEEEEEEGEEKEPIEGKSNVEATLSCMSCTAR